MIHPNLIQAPTKSKDAIFSTPKKGCENERNGGENWGADEEDILYNMKKVL